MCAGRRVMFGNATAKEDFCSHRLEELGTDRAIGGVVMRPITGVDTRKEDIIAPVVVCHWAIGRVGEALHSRQMRKGVVEPLVESCEPLVLVTSSLQIDEQEQPSLGLEAEVLMFKV